MQCCVEALSIFVAPFYCSSSFYGIIMLKGNFVGFLENSSKIINKSSMKMLFCNIFVSPTQHLAKKRQ